jgi:exodeoxyribonuclease-5
MTTLSPHQEEAVSRFRSWYRDDGEGYFLLGGYAGTGKSTILPHLIEQNVKSLSSVAFCAPTGKAAKVMRDKLKKDKVPATATTIHSLLYKPASTELDKLAGEIDSLKDERYDLLSALKGDTSDKSIKLMSAGKDSVEKRLAGVLIEISVIEKKMHALVAKMKGPSFILREDVDLEHLSLIVVDEASMVGSELAQVLLSFGIPILAIGDPGQLPPVNDNPGFMNREPDAFLTEIHRQAADNPIIWLSKQVRDGHRIKYGSHGDGALRIITRAKDDISANPEIEKQVIVGRNMTRWDMTHKIRRASGYTSTGPMEGEQMILCRNSRNDRNLVNGSFVTCVEDVGDLKKGDSSYDIEFQTEEGLTYKGKGWQGLLEECLFKQKGKSTADISESYSASKKTFHLDFGHAITCHKSQGSQWENVVVHNEAACFRDDAQRWLYTAVTRASETLTVVM